MFGISDRAASVIYYKVLDVLFEELKGLVPGAAEFGVQFSHVRLRPDLVGGQRPFFNER